MSVKSSDSSNGCCSINGGGIGGGDGIGMATNDHSSNQMLAFTDCDKISTYSLERRIDYHLKRIMKTKRLVYFKNSIETLSIEHRINECLLEIITSSNNLIGRRQRLLANALELCSQMITLAESDSSFVAIMKFFPEIKRIVSNIGQLIWALNSNKEHIKYVAKVYSLNDVYIRAGPDEENIQIKDKIVDMVQKCENTILQCQLIRLQIKRIVILAYH